MSPNKQQEEWRHDYEAYLWSPRPIWQLKYEVEKGIGGLLERDAETSPRLTYTGSTGSPPNSYRVTLRFEAALPRGNWYVLQVRASAPRKWTTKANFQRDGERAFNFWMTKLPGGPKPMSLESDPPELYAERVSEELRHEAEIANRKEDQGPILAMQQKIIKALRSGGSFRNAHKEGGMRIYFDGIGYVRDDYGEEESRATFASDEEMIAYLRRNYDWETRRDTYPHRPPELEAWKIIERLLYR